MNTNSIKHQYYDPEVYDEYVREENREGGKTNNFVRMGLKTEVLYNPARDENGKALDKLPKTAIEKASEIGEFQQIVQKENADAQKIIASEKKSDENSKKEKASLPIREITVNEIVFEVFQNSAKTLYTAKQKEGGDLIAEGKTLAVLNEELKKVTDI